MDWLKTKDEIDQEIAEREAEQRKEQIDRELDAIDKATIRAIRAEQAAKARGDAPDQKDTDRFVELEDAAVSLRSQRDSDEEIQWPEWRR